MSQRPPPACRERRDRPPSARMRLIHTRQIVRYDARPALPGRARRAGATGSRGGSGAPRRGPAANAPLPSRLTTISRLPYVVYRQGAYAAVVEPLTTSVKRRQSKARVDRSRLCAAHAVRSLAHATSHSLHHGGVHQRHAHHFSTAVAQALFQESNAAVQPEEKAKVSERERVKVQVRWAD